MKPLPARLREERERANATAAILAAAVDGTIARVHVVRVI